MMNPERYKLRSDWFLRFVSRPHEREVGTGMPQTCPKVHSRTRSVESGRSYQAKVIVKGIAVNSSSLGLSK